MKSTPGWILAVFPFLFPFIALGAPVEDATHWMLRQQSPSGAFGELTGDEPAIATAEAVQTLRLLGMGASPEAINAELYLVIAPPTPDHELALRRAQVLANTPLALAPSAFESHADGFSAPDAFQRALSLQVAYGLPGGDALSAARELAAMADPAGCFGIADQGPSISLTAEVAIALRPFASDFVAGDAYARALQCLASAHRPDGAFGSTPETTAGALLALARAPGGWGTSIAEARQYLLATQRADGSWDGSVRLTARVLRAVADSAPDWRLRTDERGRGVVILSNPEPLVGEPLTASFDVENRSAFAAPAIDVQLTASPASGGPAVLLATHTLPSLGAGETLPVAVPVGTAALAGRYELRVRVDPANAVVEADELNNEAAAPLNVRAENDLAVSSAGIQLTELADGSVKIAVTVRNLGAPLPSAAAVRIFEGSTGAAGVEIGQGNLPAGLPPNGSATVAVGWNALHANGPTAIHAVVDPDNAIAEADESNNSAYRYYYPGTTRAVALRIANADVSHSPERVVSGRPVAVSAVVHNDGSTDASRVVVQFDDPLTTGEVLGRTEVPFVAAGGTATASIELVPTVSFSLRVVVDPDQLLADSNRSDNTAYHSIDPAPAAAVELQASNLRTLQGSSPKPGAPIDVLVSVSNSGDSTAATEVRLTNLQDGTRWASVPLSLPARGAENVALGSFSMPASGRLVLEACVDPSDLHDEVNENDNCSELVLGPGSTDLVATADALRFTPYGADIGEKIHLEAAVSNASATAASAVVEFWQGRPSSPEGRYIASVPVQVGATGSVTVAHDWIRQEGPPEVFVRIRQVVPNDLDASDNFAGRHLFASALVHLPLPERNVVGEEIRVGRVTGGPEPDLVVLYQAYAGTQSRSGVALLTPDGAGGFDVLWTRDVSRSAGDLALVDGDADGTPEIYVQSYDSSTNTAQIDALSPYGASLWRYSFVSRGKCLALPYPHQLEVGDVDGDGIADLVLQDADLHVVSSKTGAVVLEVPLNKTDACAVSARAFVLDVDGDGSNEILSVNSSDAIGDVPYDAMLLDRDGQTLWRHSILKRSNQGAAVADINLDGEPELVLSLHRYALQALNASSGNVVQTGGTFEALADELSIGAARQDGLPYPAAGNNGIHSTFGGFSPDLGVRWETPLIDGNGTGTGVYVGTLSDVLGLGRPQVIAVSDFHGLSMLDARQGRILLAQQASPDGTEAYQQWTRNPPVVADVDGDGLANVVLGHIGDKLAQLGARGAAYPDVAAVVFSSPHWKAMPQTWPTRVRVRGRFRDDLTLTNDYRWWTSHNTWNQQYDVEPEELLADLSVETSGLSTSPAQGTTGEAMTLFATVENLGGLEARGAVVSFFDGDPDGGGKHIAAAMTGTLAPRTGSQTVSVSWTAYPEGEHRLFARVNPGGEIAESGAENNTAQIRVFVAPGTQVCDLVVDPSSLTATPSAPMPGDSVLLTAAVRNIGAVACAPSDMALFDGAPGGGGVLQSTSALPALVPGEAATVSFAVAPAPGTHVFHFVADDAGATLDGDRSNNDATLQLFVRASEYPDLLVTAVHVAPSPARAGEALQLVATVRNLGALAPATGFAVSGGATALATGTVPPLLPGESVQLVATALAPAQSTQWTWTLDPSNDVREFDEANNSLAFGVDVADPLLSLQISAAPASVGPEQNVTATCLVANDGPWARELGFDLVAVSPAGAPIATLATQRLVLAPGTGSAIGATWSSGRLPPGTYALRARVLEGLRVAKIASTPVSILAETGVAGSLAVDRGSYAPGADVILTHRLVNTSRNAPLQGAHLALQVEDPGGLVLQTTSRRVPDVPAGGYVESGDLFGISPQLVPGTYIARSAVTDDRGVQLASAQASFEVQYAPPDEVTGVVTCRSPFAIGHPLEVEVGLENAGGLDVDGANLEVSLFDAATLSLEAAAEQTVTLPAGARVAEMVLLPTSAVTEGQKLLVAKLAGRVLDDALVQALRVVDIDPPVIRVEGVTDLLWSRFGVTPVVTVEDQSPVLVALTLDAAPFTSGTEVDTEGTHLLEVQAQDVYGNAAALSVRFTLDFTAPVIVITGVAEGAVGTSFTPAFTASDDWLASVSAELDGAPFESGARVDSTGPHTLVVVAEDRAGNRAVETVHFNVFRVRPELPLGACALETLHMEGVASIHGAEGQPVSVGANGAVLLENNATIDGDVAAGGDVVLRNSASVSGDLIYGGALWLAPGSDILGEAHFAVPPPRPCGGEYDIDAAFAFVAAHNDNARLASLPGASTWLRDGALALNNGSLILPHGRYLLTGVMLAGTANLSAAAGSSVELFVDGSVVVGETSELGATGGGEMLIVSRANSGSGGAIRVQQHTGTALRLYAPWADIDLENHSVLEGSVLGRRLHLRNNAALVLTAGGQP